MQIDPKSRAAAVLRLLTPALFLTGLAAPVAAQLSQEAREEMKESEGAVAERERYLVLRHQKPDDPTFDVAAARVAALEERRIQALAPAPLVPNTGTVWSALGPQPITQAQTGAIRSNASGRVAALAIDPVGSPRAIYMGGAQGGAWRSTDDGVTWVSLSDNLASLAVSTLTIDTVTAHTATTATIFMGTGESNGSADSYAGVGIYKSTNSGTTWSGPLGNAEFRGRAIGSVTLDRTNVARIVVPTASGVSGIGAGQAAGLAPRGIYLSTDGGATWSCRSCGVGGTDNNRFNNVVQDPVTPTTWWASGWFSALGAGTLNGGLVKSTDNGSTWTQIGGTGGLPAAAAALGRATVVASAAPAAVNSTLYFGESTSNGRLWRSTDSGVTWTALAAANGFCNPQCFYDQPLWAVPGVPSTLYIGGAAGALTMRRSTDSGATFTAINTSGDATTALHADNHVIITDPVVNTIVWDGNDGGVWRSTDQGANWQNRNANLNLTQFQSVDMHPTNVNLAFGGTQDNGTNTWSGGLTWAHTDDGDGGFALIDKSTPTRAVHTYFNQQSNLMATAVDVTLGPNATPNDWPILVGACSAAVCGVNIANGINIADRVLFYAPIHLDRGATDTYYYGTNKLYRSTDFFTQAAAATTTTVIFTALNGNNDLTAGTGALSAIETFAAQAPGPGGTSAAIIYTGSSDGRVFRSTNSGTSFTQVDAPNIYVSDVAVQPSNSNVVYSSLSGFSGAAGQNIRKSTDGGATWAASASGIPDIPVNALVIDPTDNTRVWAGTDVGVYLSTNSGASWIVWGTGLPNVAVFDLAANGNPGGNGAIIAATHGRGMYRLTPLTPLELTGFTVE